MTWLDVDAVVVLVVEPELELEDEVVGEADNEVVDDDNVLEGVVVVLVVVVLSRLEVIEVVVITVVDARELSEAAGSVTTQRRCFPSCQTFTQCEWAERQRVKERLAYM